jgi:hypothetical protein
MVTIIERIKIPEEIIYQMKLKVKERIMKYLKDRNLEISKIGETLLNTDISFLFSEKELSYNVKFSLKSFKKFTEQPYLIERIIGILVQLERSNKKERHPVLKKNNEKIKQRYLDALRDFGLTDAEIAEKLKIEKKKTDEIWKFVMGEEKELILKDGMQNY